MKTKNKNKNNSNTFWDKYKGFIIIAVVITMMYGLSAGWFDGIVNIVIENEINQGDIDLGNFDGVAPDITNTECTLTPVYSNICLGESVTGTLNGYPNTLFYVGVNHDSSDWELAGQRVTGATGSYTETVVPNAVGEWRMRAISDKCLTNVIIIDVRDCSSSDDSSDSNDDDGINDQPPIPCESIVSPTSQARCDTGYCYDNPDNCCVFVPATLVYPAKCECQTCQI